MLFRNCSLMLIFLLKDKTAESVQKVFDMLSDELGIKAFCELSRYSNRLCRIRDNTDNDIKSQSPDRLKKTTQGEVRTNIYYCNPYVPGRKA